ncbi:hypothetical protein GGF32_005302 [Allomyces javanicus]|nr:hypothetical protein GGF32_005302 [Allomyces javanicus]
MTTTDLQETVLFVGNPGTGKTTLFNSIAGKVIGKSGVSFGGGIMFENLQYAIVDGIKWVDTPGLADVKQRELAAKGITMALKQPGRYRLIFVVTEKAGRANPLDVATIATVLNAIDQKNIPFGVIINKVSPKIMKRVVCNPAEKQSLCMSINSGFYQTEHFYVAKLLRDAYDNDDYICPGEIVAPIKAFIGRVPTVEIQPDMIEKMDANKLDDVAQTIEQMVGKMMEQQRVQIETMQRKHEEDLAELRKQHEQNRALVELQRAEAQQRYEAAERERRAAEERFHEAQIALTQQQGAKEIELMKLEIERTRQDMATAAELENEAKVELMQSQDDDNSDDDEDDDFSFRGVILRGFEAASATLERVSTEENSPEPSVRSAILNGLEAALKPLSKEKQKSSFRRSLLHTLRSVVLDDE